MKVLYLTEDFVGSRVHHNLCNSLSAADNNTEITLFNIERPGYPLRDLRDSYTNQKYTAVSVPLKGNMFLYKTFFPYKTSRKMKLLQSNIDLQNTDLTIAGTLFSDGAVALRLWRQFSIPYVVVVRGTDVNLYMCRMPHLYSLGRQIVANAKKVIFISPSQMRQTMQSPVFSGISDMLNAKSELITNGIDSIWIENQYFGNEWRSPDSLLYVGIFDRNKNVGKLIEACRQVRKKRPNLTLNLVGGGGDCEPEILKLAADNGDWIKFHGAVYDKQQLMTIFRQNSVFAMISLSETFGLVYLEALTQGLPVVYTENQGFDGIIDNLSVGYAVNPNNVSDIAANLESALKNREKLLLDMQKIDFSVFSWQKKAEEWLRAIRE